MTPLGQLAVPIAVLGIVIALITPLPSLVLDLLIATDILISVTVLMVSLYLVRPVEFTSFPTTLLLLTLLGRTEGYVGEDLVVETNKGKIRGVTLKSATNK